MIVCFGLKIWACVIAVVSKQLWLNLVQRQTPPNWTEDGRFECLSVDAERAKSGAERRCCTLESHG